MRINCMLTKPINAKGPPAIRRQKVEIIMVPKIPRTTQFVHLDSNEKVKFLWVVIIGFNY